MTQETVPFPNHQFDFADLVLVQPLQATGAVMGIRLHNADWYYLIDTPSQSDIWWPESQLAFAPDSAYALLPENSP